MQVHLRKKKLKSGKYSLYLDIYKGGLRNYEFLGIYVKKGEPDYKIQLELAEKIRSQRMIDLSHSEYEQINPQRKKASFIDYYEQFLTKKKKWSNYHGALKHLKDFIDRDVIFKEINKKWFQDFIEYMQVEAKLKPNTVFIYFRKIKEVLYKASADGFISHSLLTQIKSPPKENKKRDFLELSEIEILAITESDRPEIKKAFLFSCFTGLRQSDIRKLKWGNIEKGVIKIVQQKTQDKLEIPISETAKKLIQLDSNLIPHPEKEIFSIPKDRSTINRSLKRWFDKAGVKKTPIYHISRHTFATLNLTRGNEIYTVSKLLGHKSLKTTEIYSNLIDEKKQEAIDNLPVINL